MRGVWSGETGYIDFVGGGWMMGRLWVGVWIGALWVWLVCPTKLMIFLR